MKKIKYLLFVIFAIFMLVACGEKKEEAKTEAPVELKKVDFLLDWVPNTNHTGLYVAKEKGYFAEEGIDLDIKQPANESTSDLVINNKAPMGVYFQDYMASKLAKGAPITAVAAIIENNTSGIITNKKSTFFNSTGASVLASSFFSPQAINIKIAKTTNNKYLIFFIFFPPLNISI